VNARRAVALGSLIAYAAFIGIVLAVPFVKEGFSPLSETISEGAIGEHAWLQATGFAALIAASAGISWLLYEERHVARGLALTAALLAVSTLFTVALAVFPTDAPAETTTTGRIHITSAALAFIIALAGITSASWTFRGHPRLSRLAAWSFAAGVSAYALLLLTGSGIEPTGLWQRATVAIEVMWFVSVALVLISAPRASSAVDPSPGRSAGHAR
jgi:hypothetical protein